MQIVGVAFKEGEFQGIPYNKVKLHCKGAFEDANSVGEQVEVYSLNYDTCDNLFKYCDGSPELLLGVSVEVIYNKYGKPQKVFILED